MTYDHSKVVESFAPSPIVVAAVDFYYSANDCEVGKAPPTMGQKSIEDG